MTREPITAELDQGSLRELRRALDRAADAANAGIGIAVRGTAEALASLEANLAPRDTGKLADSVEAKVADNGLSATVGPNGDAWYAYLVEWGTSRRPATPYATPTAERGRVDFPRAVINEVRRRIR